MRLRGRERTSTAVSSWLPAGAPYVFNPLDLSPALWLDASDTTTITSSGSPATVSQWNDKSGNGFNVTQATGAAQPTTGASTRNSLNVLDFDGGDLLNYAGTTGINVGAVTIYVVANTNGAADTGFVVLYPSSGDDFGSDSAVVLERTTNNTRYFTGIRNVSTSLGRADIAGTGATPFGAYTAVFRSDGSLDVWRDGVIGTSGTRARTFGVAAGGFLIGGRYVGGQIIAGARLNGQIAEALVFAQSHTTSQRQTVEAYLKAKWGTP